MLTIYADTNNQMLPINQSLDQ